MKLGIVVTPGATGTLSNTATVSSTGYTETNTANDSDTATTTVVAAPIEQPVTPNTPSEDKTMNAVLLVCSANRCRRSTSASCRVCASLVTTGS